MRSRSHNMAARRISRLLQYAQNFVVLRAFRRQDRSARKYFYSLLATATGGCAYYGYNLWMRDRQVQVLPVVYAKQDEDTDADRKLTYREARFRQFASVEYDGTIYMTPQDFLESITEESPRPRIGRTQLSRQDLETWLRHTPKRSKGSDHLFRDLHDKGIISYTEYLFLLCVLTKPHSGFRIAFNMFDTDGNQIVDKREFLVLENYFILPKHERKFVPRDAKKLQAILDLERVFSKQGQSKLAKHPTEKEHKEDSDSKHGQHGDSHSKQDHHKDSEKDHVQHDDSGSEHVHEESDSEQDHHEHSEQDHVQQHDSEHIHFEETEEDHAEHEHSDSEHIQHEDTDSEQDHHEHTESDEDHPEDAESEQESLEENVQQGDSDIDNEFEQESAEEDVPQGDTDIGHESVQDEESEHVEEASHRLKALIESLHVDIPDTTLLIHFFGPRGDDVLNYQDFHKFMANLQSEVIELEFLEFSRGMTTISEVDFAKILLRYTDLDRMEINACLDRVRTRIPVEKGITFEEFRQFCQFLNNLDDFSLSMKMYTYAQKSVSQEDFQRAVKVCTGYKLGDHVVNTVFQIFDSDGDGHLSHKEFISIMKDRLHRGARSHLMHTQNSWDAFRACVRNEMRTF